MKLSIFALAAVWISFCSSIYAYSGGTGEPNDPYQIGTVADWQMLISDPCTWDASFVLVRDIDFSGASVTPVAQIDSNSFYFEGTQFTGMFNGNGHVLRNITIHQPDSDYVGVFGCVGANGQIVSLGVEDANITGRLYVGGLAGYNRGPIIAGYVSGNIEGNSYVGGLVGYDDNPLTISCYSTAKVTGDSYVGGLAGTKWGGSSIDCFWDMQSSGQPTSAEGTGKTTAEMKNLETYLAAGWDFAGERANGLHDFWQMAGNDYPHLAPRAIWTLAGEGTATNPYIIADVNDLAKIWLRPIGCYRLAGDLDLSGISWSTAVIPSFSGSFDGGDHAIKNIMINRPWQWFVGLFGHVYIGAQIHDLGIEDVNINGDDGVGGLIGDNNGSITNCYSTGTITGSEDVGGLIGWSGPYGAVNSCYTTGRITGDSAIGGLVGSNANTAITSCYSTGKVTGGDEVGGLVGLNDFSGTITSCYSTGNVIGDSYVGGLLGFNWLGTIANCYSVGAVKGTGSYVGGLLGGYYYSVSTTASFWDVQASGQANSAGGTGKTTAEMQSESSFVDAGWDFVNIWSIRDGTDYPRLMWQKNNFPRCEAGADQTVFADIDLRAEISLDGSDSNDLDGDALTYKWTWEIDGQPYEAEGVRPTIELPVGMHTIQLIVNDGQADSEPDEVVVTVIEPLEGMLKVTPSTINSKNKQKEIDAVIKLPTDIDGSDLDGMPALMIYPGEIKATKQTIRAGQIWASFDKDAVCGAAGSGNAELKVCGKLKSGQYFYGSDTIKIIH
jgi:hypothetical protein